MQPSLPAIPQASGLILRHNSLEVSSPLFSLTSKHINALVQQFLFNVPDFKNSNLLKLLPFGSANNLLSLFYSTFLTSFPPHCRLQITFPFIQAIPQSIHLKLIYPQVSWTQRMHYTPHVVNLPSSSSGKPFFLCHR